METILAYVNVGVSALLAVGCLMLFIDGRGQRVALRAAQATIAALQRQVAGHAEQIGNLSRAVGLLVPADARPTAPHKPAPLAPSRTFRPSPAQVDDARRGHAEAQREALGAPVDTEGDRAAYQGEDGADAIRARFEAEAEARSQARGEGAPALPTTATDDEPEDEPTRAYRGGRGVRRATLLGLAGAPLERPTSSAKRTADAFRREHPSSPTLVSEGVTPPPSSAPPSSSAPRSIPLDVLARLDASTLARLDAQAARLGITREEILIRCAEAGATDLEALVRTLRTLGPPANDATADRETLTPTAPGALTMDARVERLWHQKIAAAQEAGQHVEHCHGERCVLDACECRCDGCVRVNGLLAEARREVMGRE